MRDHLSAAISANGSGRPVLADKLTVITHAGIQRHFLRVALDTDIRDAA
jgi:hypothetical protein